jgi:hypothetical protein
MPSTTSQPVQLPVDVATMADPKNQNDELADLDLIDHPI